MPWLLISFQQKSIRHKKKPSGCHEVSPTFGIWLGAFWRRGGGGDEQLRRCVQFSAAGNCPWERINLQNSIINFLQNKIS